MEDIENKEKKRRPVKKEKKTLDIKIKELKEQVFDFGVRPTIANADTQGRTLNLSPESVLLLRKILILVTSGMEMTALRDKLLEYTNEFASCSEGEMGLSVITYQRYKDIYACH
ncbi:hypothetical protein EAE96_008662 [Botrytis aclada]|nr:hypothetical protein EAE96_008662 [Botrytis aclada]